MFLLSLILFAGNLLGPVKIPPSSALSPSRALSLSPSPQRRVQADTSSLSPAKNNQADTVTYDAYWEKPPADALSLVPEGENSKPQAEDLLKVLADAKNQTFAKYDNTSEAKIGNNFTIVSWVQTAGLYRVQQNGGTEMYNLVVRNAVNIQARNKFMELLLDSYSNRETIFIPREESPSTLRDQTPKPSISAGSHSHAEGRGETRRVREITEACEQAREKIEEITMQANMKIRVVETEAEQEILRIESVFNQKKEEIKRAREATEKYAKDTQNQSTKAAQLEESTALATLGQAEKEAKIQAATVSADLAIEEDALAAAEREKNKKIEKIKRNRHKSNNSSINNRHLIR